MIFYSMEISNSCNIKYKYKNDSSQNLINLGAFKSLNYIPMQITKNDSSLVFYLEYSSIYYQSKVEIMDVNIEVNFYFNSTIKGPKYIIFDYYKINGLNTFIIESNRYFSFREQKLDSRLRFKIIFLYDIKMLLFLKYIKEDLFI